MRKVTRIAAAGLAVVIAGSIGIAAQADLLGSIVKGGAISILIKQFNRPLNDGINKLTGSAGVQYDEATKVVPIVTIGQGSYAGAAQVSGPQDRVDQVQAVGMLEGSLNGRTFRMKALIPITTDKPGSSKKVERVKGVGVSAIIDIKV